MLNISLYHLMCNLMPIRSPLIQSSFRTSHFSLFSSNFYKVTSTIFSSHTHGIYDISSCSFKHILNSAVKVTGIYIFQDKNLSKLFLSEAIGYCFEYTKLQVTQCRFQKCVSNSSGGGFCCQFCLLDINDTYFDHNNAKYGGGSHCSSLYNVTCTRNVYFGNSAEYDGGCMFATDQEEKATYFSHINLTDNMATMWTGGFRIDQCGGVLKNAFFANNHALVCGGFFDFSWYPSQRNVSKTIFFNNTAIGRTGAATAFHLYQFMSFNLCMFIFNKCEKSANSISIESVRTTVEIQNCMFSGSKEEELIMRYEGSQFVEKGMNFYSCTNDQLNERYWELKKIHSPILN